MGDIFPQEPLTNADFGRGCCEAGGCALIRSSCSGLPFFMQEETIPRGKENGAKVLLTYGLHLGGRAHTVCCIFWCRTFYKSCEVQGGVGILTLSLGKISAATCSSYCPLRFHSCYLWLFLSIAYRECHLHFCFFAARWTLWVP